MIHIVFEDLPSEAFLRLPVVLSLVGLRKSSVYALIQQERFPPPEKLTAHASGWRVRDVRAWLLNPTAWRAEDRDLTCDPLPR